MNKIKDLLVNNDLNYNFELALFFSYNIILIVLGGYLLISGSSIVLLLLDILLFLLLNVGNLYRIYLKIEKKTNSYYKQAKDMFSYIYLDLNNKVTLDLSLTRAKKCLNVELNDAMNTFIKKKKDNLTSTPYIEFAKTFRIFDVEEMMLVLYSYEQHKDIAVLNQFNHCYLNFKKNYEESLSKNNDKKYDLLKNSAIIGAGLIVVLLIASLIIVSRGYING